MGLVYADIELINREDRTLAKSNIIGEEEIRRINVNILVDIGRYYLYINENIQQQLGFSFIEKRKGQLADGTIAEYDVVDPVEVKFKNRRFNIDAMVLKGDNEPLLGAMPMEDMDVLIHPLRQELIINPEHPYFAQMKLK
jgi:clan AA aspartic protease